MPTPKRIGSRKSWVRNRFSLSTFAPIIPPPPRPPAPARVKPEEPQHAVTDELVGPAAALDHRLRHRAEKTVDDEHGVERQPLFGHTGRAAHVHEHADEITLLANSGGVRCTSTRRYRMRQEQLEERQIRGRPQ